MITKTINGKQYGTFENWGFDDKVQAESFINTFKADSRYTVDAKIQKAGDRYYVFIRTEKK